MTGFLASGLVCPSNMRKLLTAIRVMYNIDVYIIGG